MATGGGKPGVTFMAKVVAVSDVDVTFNAVNDKPSDYLKVGDEGVVQFQPAPPEHHSGGSGEPGNT